MPNGKNRWVVEVLDAQADPVEIFVHATGGKAVLIPPSTGAIIVPHRAVEELCDAIRGADEAAEKQRTAGA